MAQKFTQLSKTLLEVLTDKDVLPYLIQFMQSQDASSLLNFWLDVNSFKSSSSYKLLSLEINSLSITELDCNKPKQSIMAHGIIPSQEIDFSLISEACNSAPLRYCNSSQADSFDLIAYNNNNLTKSIESNFHENNLESNVSDSVKKSIKEDAVAIFLKYLSPDSHQRVILDDQLFNDTIKSICHENHYVDLSCFDQSQNYIFNLIEQRYYNNFVQSAYHYKHQLDILLSNSLSFNDIIYYSTSMSYFAEFMELNKAANFLQCYFDLDNFEQRFLNQSYSKQENVSNNDNQSDAIVIYDRYFSLQALKPLNFSDEIRIEIENNICSETGITPECFKIPKEKLYNHLTKVHFPLFLKSNIFYQYIAELINVVHSNPDLVGYKRMDHCSKMNEKKLKNTLLATNDIRSSKSEKIVKSNSVDTLWIRNQNKSMELGRVDEFGCYKSEYDQLPSQNRLLKSGFLFGKRNSLDEEQEAIMAAVQILNDINNMTSKSNNNLK